MKIASIKQNVKCRLYENRDEMVNDIINESSKLAQKDHKTLHNWVEKMIHWELCKRLKFDYAYKW